MYIIHPYRFSFQNDGQKQFRPWSNMSAVKQIVPKFLYLTIKIAWKASIEYISYQNTFKWILLLQNTLIKYSEIYARRKSVESWSEYTV